MQDILGIDPGSRRTGWGIVRDVSGTLSLVDCGVIMAAEFSDTFSRRLGYIYHEICGLITKYDPDEVAMEQIFTAHNIASALKLGQARGAAVSACAAMGKEVFDYEPTLVKKTITGVGRADKIQVAFMVGKLLNLKNSGIANNLQPLSQTDKAAQKNNDATDALSIAICHLTSRRWQNLAKKIAI